LSISGGIRRRRICEFGGMGKLGCWSRVIVLQQLLTFHINNQIFFRSEAFGVSKNGLPAIRSNAIFPTLQFLAANGITAAIGAKILNSLGFNNLANVKPIINN